MANSPICRIYAKAMSTQATGSNFRHMIYPGDALSLEVFLFWMDNLESLQKNMLASILVQNGNNRRQKLAFNLPLGNLDNLLVGHENKFWREWLIHNLLGDNYWKGGDNSDGVIVTTASNYILTGWHDFFLPKTINDYLKMQSEGKIRI